MRFSFQMLPEQPATELLDAIAAADRLGYYACYSADEIYHKDAWLLFAAAAQRTVRIRLGPCVAPIYMRDPTYVAQLAATLDELSDGRAEVVFGIGNIAMLEQYGVEWRGTRPIARLREAHQVMRTVLDEGAISFEGDFYRYTGVTTASHPVQEHLPLKIGAMGGPKSMQLAGEIADGLHTACAYSTEALGYAVEHFQAGVERAGRNPDGLDLGDSLLGAIARDGDVARRAGRILAAFYIPSMPPALLELHGIEPESVAAVTEAFAAGDVQRGLEATPEEVADRIMVAGTPEDWVRWLTHTYAPAGLDHALVSFTDPFTLRAWAGIESRACPIWESRFGSSASRSCLRSARSKQVRASHLKREPVFQARRASRCRQRVPPLRAASTGHDEPSPSSIMGPSMRGSPQQRFAPQRKRT